MRKLLFTLAAPIAAAVVAILPTAAQAATGPPVFTPEQAGYSATGGHFRYVAETFTLPNAATFADNVDSFGISVQLKSAGLWPVLGISAVTSGGGYNAAFAAFAGDGVTLLGSNGASPTMAAGDVVTEKLFYNRDTGFLVYRVNDATAGTNFHGSFHVGPSVSFNQVRAGAEFACQPGNNLNCSTPRRFNAPAVQTNLVLLRNAHITSYSGHRAGWISWWTRHKLVMTSNGLSSGVLQAFPGGLWNSGHNFTVRLHA
jgi:hypothetical protein